ncbi:hypothetical protein ZEAMMB73_Zm00001d016639 [Zea mays]|uniref:Uncharacterized protein n=1 Tax=Zea mays TaxID=4577 RepID=A0A1D6H9E7_MAIZE|nr:hypothetical protein ZEAMMB73_Zm00001d016639 [Zea mays]
MCRKSLRGQTHMIQSGRKRKMSIKESVLRRSGRRLRNFSDDDESESSESDGEKPLAGEQRRDDEDEEEETEGRLRTSEVVRREMGLQWMLKPAISGELRAPGLIMPRRMKLHMKRLIRWFKLRLSECLAR